MLKFQILGFTYGSRVAKKTTNMVIRRFLCHLLDSCGVLVIIAVSNGCVVGRSLLGDVPAVGELLIFLKSILSTICNDATL